MSRTRIALDRTTVVALAAGLVMLQVLIFSAGFLVGAAEGVQALTPPAPPLPVPEERKEIQLASLSLGGASLSREAGEGRGGGTSEPARPQEPAAIAPETPRSVDVGAGLVPAREGVNPSTTSLKARTSKPASRPSPLAQAALILPAPPVKPRATRVRKAPSLPRTAEAYAAMIREAAERHSVPPMLVEAVARVESGLNPRALSHKGARGLMQVIPATGRRFGVRPDKLFDPEHNLNAGVAYLAWLSKRYRGNLDLVLAAYNAGEGAVDDHGGIPPYRETRDYVRRVRAALRSIEENAPSTELAAAPSPEAKQDEPEELPREAGQGLGGG